MLVGELPFHAPTVPGILVKQLTEEAPLVSTKRPDCPADLTAAVARCLAKDPDDRWPTADGLRRALESRTATAPKPAPLVRRPPPPPPPAPVAKPARAERRPAQAQTAEAPVVQRARATFVRWAMVSGPADPHQPHHRAPASPDWSLAIPRGFWPRSGSVPRYVRLWRQAGYSWRATCSRGPRPRTPLKRGPGRRATATSSGLATTRCGRPGTTVAGFCGSWRSSRRARAQPDARRRRDRRRAFATRRGARAPPPLDEHRCRPRRARDARREGGGDHKAQPRMWNASASADSSSAGATRSRNSSTDGVTWPINSSPAV